MQRADVLCPKPTSRAAAPALYRCRVAHSYVNHIRAAAPGRQAAGCRVVMMAAAAGAAAAPSSGEPAATTPMAASVASFLAENPAVRVAAALVVAVQRVASHARQLLVRALPGLEAVDSKDVARQVRQLRRHASMLAVVLPFAKAATADAVSRLYSRTFERAAFGFAKMFLFCLFMRVLLSWFPSIDWNAKPWSYLRMITEPYLQIYRGIVPPLFGQLDFTPLVGFLVLQDVVETMAPNYTIGRHEEEMFSEEWTTSDPLAFFNGK